MREEMEKAMLEQSSDMNMELIKVQRQFAIIEQKLNDICCENSENNDLQDIRNILVNDIQDSFSKVTNNCLDLYGKIKEAVTVREIHRLMFQRLEILEKKIEDIKLVIS